jgi:hypothetical protein
MKSTSILGDADNQVKDWGRFSSRDMKMWFAGHQTIGP